MTALGQVLLFVTDEGEGTLVGTFLFCSVRPEGGANSSKASARDSALYYHWAQGTLNDAPLTLPQGKAHEGNTLCSDVSSCNVRQNRVILTTVRHPNIKRVAKQALAILLSAPP